MNRDLAKMCLTAIISLLAVIVCCVVFSSCRTQYIPMEGETKIVEKEILIPVVNPADSASIRAFLECDENGRVVLRWFDIEKSKNMQLQFSLDSLGNLLANAKTGNDTIYLPSKEISIEKKVPVPYPVERQLNRWESMKMELGGWAFGGFIVMALVIVGWLVLQKGNK